MEQDVAVDPEMLGKVFENMLEERDRGQSGSFYTPRAIVSYMCQEALAGYLEESANIPRDTTRAQFDPDSHVRFTADEATRANTALNTVTALDPAVGSGSFLIGMMNEIIRLRRACYAALNDTDDVPSQMLANWKEAIIRDTLYGVDIKPEAIEIAQLRLWLALIVDQAIDDVKPLPNLDYKLMAGNSLIETLDGEPILSATAQTMIGGDVTPTQPMLGIFATETEKERGNLAELRDRFFKASTEERKRLKADITAQEKRIVETSLREKAEGLQTVIDNLGKSAARQGGRLNRTETNKLNAAVEKLTRITQMQEDMGKPDYVPPFFLYRLHFSEIFDPQKGKGGFDIVVANPPYVRGELLGDQKPELKASYPDVYAGTADLYVYFFARAYRLLRANGQLSFITSNKYLRANYGKGLRKFLTKAVRLTAIFDFGDLPVFDAAAYPCIVLADKQVVSSNVIPAVAVRDMAALDGLHASLLQGTELKQAELGESEWQIAPADVQRVFAKLKAAGIPLGKYVSGKIYYGIKTGFNEAFVIDEAKRAELIAAHPKSADVIKPWLRGRDVKRWTVNSQNLYIIFTRKGIDIDLYPAIKAHLETWREDLTPKITGLEAQGRKPGPYEWYEIQDNVAYYAEFDKPKIAFADIVQSRSFVMAKPGEFFDTTIFFIGNNDPFLLGMLNSSMMDFFIYQTSSSVRGGFFRYKKTYVEPFPIPMVSDVMREKIATLAQRCLDTTKTAPEKLPALEAELNALVYEAYGLDAGDIAVIEAHLAGKSASGTVASGDEE